jgi:hypothetical protein
LVAQFAGIAILGLIMIIAFYNDFIRIFSWISSDLIYFYLF